MIKFLPLIILFASIAFVTSSCNFIDGINVSDITLSNVTSIEANVASGVNVTHHGAVGQGYVTFTVEPNNETNETGGD